MHSNGESGTVNFPSEHLNSDFNPNSECAIYLISQIFVKQNQIEEALFYLNRLIAANPAHLNSFFLRACCFNLKGSRAEVTQGNFQKAIDDYNRALEIDQKIKRERSQQLDSIKRNMEHRRSFLKNMQNTKENSANLSGRNFDFCSFSNLNVDPKELKKEKRATVTKFETEEMFFEGSQVKRDFFCSLKSNAKTVASRRTFTKRKGGNDSPKWVVPNWPSQQKRNICPENAATVKSDTKRQRRLARKRCYLDLKPPKNAKSNLFFKSKLMKTSKKEEYTPSGLFKTPANKNELEEEENSIEVMADPFDLDKRVKQFCRGRRSKQTKSTEKRARHKSTKSGSSVAEKLQRSSRSLSRGMSCFDRALILKKQKLYKKALLFFKKVKPGDPKYVDSLFYQAFLLDKDNRCSEAIALYQQFVALKPKNAFGYFNLGICYKQNGQFEDSLRVFSKVNIFWGDLSRNGNLKAIEIQPKYAEFYYNRACILKKLGRKIQAKLDFGYSLQLLSTKVAKFPSRIRKQFLKGATEQPR